jgi:acetyl esterase/lipase
MAERLRSVGADVEVHILPGAGHGDGFREAGAHRMTRQFLMDQLLSGR